MDHFYGDRLNLVNFRFLGAGDLTRLRKMRGLDLIFLKSGNGRSQTPA